MNQKHSLTEGNILKSLLTFAVPVFFSLLLQALYGVWRAYPGRVACEPYSGRDAVSDWSWNPGVQPGAGHFMPGHVRLDPPGETVAAGNQLPFTSFRCCLRNAWTVTR